MADKLNLYSDHPEAQQHFDAFLANVFSHKTETQLWLESDQVSKVCREWEVERLEEDGIVIGGLA